MALLLCKLAGFAAEGRTGGDPFEYRFHHLRKDFATDNGVFRLLGIRQNHTASLEVTVIPSTVPKHEFFLSVG